MSDAIEDIIGEAAQDPKSASNDGLSATGRDLRELIDADKYLKQSQAAAGSRMPFQLVRTSPPGAV